MGKSFQFPLQKVLEYRESRENYKASKLSQSMKKLTEEQDKQYQIEEEKGKVIQDDSANESASIHQLKVSSDYIIQLNDNLEKQGEIVTNAEEIVETDNQKLINATRDKKVVEILRDKQKLLFNKEKKKQELKFNDEQASRISHLEKRNSQ